MEDKNKNRLNLLTFSFILFIISPITSSIQHSAAFRDIIIPFILMLFLIVIFKIEFSLKINHAYSLLLWMSAILSTFVNNQGFNRQSFTYLFFVLFYILTTSIPWNSKSLKGMAKSYITVATLCSLIIIGGFFLNTPYSWQRYSLDLIGIHKNPNYVMSFIAGAYCIVLYLLLFFKHYSKRKKILLSSIIITMLISGVFTGTRAGILTMTLCTLFQFLFFLIKKKDWKNIFLAIIVSLILYLIVSSYIPQINLNRVINIDSYSDLNRTTAWKLAFYEYQYRPILGLGIGGTMEVLASLGTTIIDDLHNIILELLFDQGLFGITVFSLMVFDRFSHTKKEDRVFILSMCLALFIPILFQNGLIAVAFWWPVILFRIICNYSAASNFGIINS